MVARVRKAQSTSGARAARRPNTASQDREAISFEELLSELSTAFVRVSVDRIDDEIEQWLERIVLAMGVDRSTIVQVGPADRVLRISHVWARQGFETEWREQEIRELGIFPWTLGRLRAGESVVMSRLEDFPPEASKDRESLRQVGNKSIAAIPVKIGGTVVGAASFGALRFEKHWSEREVQRLKLIAEIFGNAFERIRAEAEIRRLSEELRHTSQVMTMGELTASLAHELNQPLGAILNNAKAARRLLVTKTPDLKEIDYALDDIIRDDARTVEIVKNVRSLFQRGEAKMATVDVGQLLLVVDRIVRTDARTKEISWSMGVSDSLPSVRGDTTHLTQAVLNLVLNAFDSVSENHGPREVTLGARLEDPREIRISVCDSGKGIEPSVMPRLFDPFFTTKSTGMGMGLTIVRSIIENHGGRIWATQNPYRGATFEFALPVSE